MIADAEYSVVTDERDDIGNGDYLRDASFDNLQDAIDYLQKHPRCTHIDYFDGDEWHYSVMCRRDLPDNGNKNES